MFEQALRLKLRFDYRGLCTTEDLFDLSVEVLDSLYKNLNSEFKECKEESLLEKKSKDDEILELKINIIKYIVESKLEEKRIKADLLKIRRHNQKILGVISEKEDEELKGKSISELKELIKNVE